MKQILVIGAGRSSVYLYEYLLTNANKYNWQITAADSLQDNLNALDSSITKVVFDVFNKQQRTDLVQQSDIVVSLLPASLHIEVAKTCVELGKNLVTASYVSPVMKALNKQAKSKSVLLLNEMGLDPGIDHMSAMQIIDRIKQQGDKITDFTSYTGGLVAPESDNNPWNYKITWNPKNVVTAGSAGATFLKSGKIETETYHNLYINAQEFDLGTNGVFEGYANRDSTKYKELYQLNDIETLIRGTFRKAGFCKAWNCLVQLGLTKYDCELPKVTSFYDLTEYQYRKYNISYLSLKDWLLQNEALEKFEYLGLLSSDKLPTVKSCGDLIERLLVEKLAMKPSDKDMIVMQHNFNYLQNGVTKKHTSTLVAIGEDSVKTAMAKTVGLPVGIAVKLILTEELNLSGVHIPVITEIYEPVLEELKEWEIGFVQV